MRVVAGSARGLRIGTPPGDGVRPTTDRVREATFNALGSLGLVEGKDYVDAFAGSGALGIEALSRGAARCVFCESDRGALAALRENLASTGLVASAEVHAGDSMALLAPGGPLAGHRADVLLADPPYAFDRWPELFELSCAPVVVAESDRPVGAPAGWHESRQRRYGGTVVTIVERNRTPEC